MAKNSSDHNVEFMVIQKLNTALLYLTAVNEGSDFDLSILFCIKILCH